MEQNESVKLFNLCFISYNVIKAQYVEIARCLIITQLTKYYVRFESQGLSEHYDNMSVYCIPPCNTLLCSNTGVNKGTHFYVSSTRTSYHYLASCHSMLSEMSLPQYMIGKICIYCWISVHKQLILENVGTHSKFWLVNTEHITKTCPQIFLICKN